MEVLDVFVSPAREELSGVIILEAMACGKPVIATSVGGVYRIVRDQETGLLVRRDDPNAIAAAVSRLLDDPAFARQIAARAREFVRSGFDLASCVEKTLAFYETALARKTSA